MGPIRRKPTALIVNDDLGLVFWFGDIFGKAGWNVVPALNCRQAVTLAAMWDLHIDLIIVGAVLSGISEMVQTLSRVHRPKIVIIRDSDFEAGIPADATLDRPDLGTADSRAEWVERIRKLLKELERKPFRD